LSGPDQLDRLAVLAGRSWSSTELPGGLTNVNLRVRTDDALDPPLDLVVRYSANDPGMLGIDRTAEHHNTDAAARAGVGAPVVEFRPDLQMLVIDFLPGRALSNHDFTDPAVLGRAGSAVRSLHAGPRFCNDFDMFALQASYLATIRAGGFRLPAGYDSYADQWNAVRGALATAPRATMPCNNDLLAANFIDDGERVWLIDYEYSGNNDPCFELGNTAAECGFTPEMIEAWAVAYFGDPTPADVARVRLQALCSCYGWALWGFIQAATSPLDFDFWAWGTERFEKAREAFADPGLAELMARVSRG